MNNNIGMTNNCGVGCGGFGNLGGIGNNDSLIMILFLLMFLSPNTMGGFGGDSLMMLLFLFMLMPSFGRGI